MSSTGSADQLPTTPPPPQDSSVTADRRAKKQPPNTVAIELGDADTLERIAVLSEISVAELMRLNGLFSRMVAPGTILFVPERYMEHREQSSAAAQERARADSEPSRPSLDAAHFTPVKTPMVYKVHARHVIDVAESVGEITLTSDQFFFEPAMHDMTAVELGLAITSVNVDLRYITSCDTETVRTQRERPADDGFAAVTEHDAVLLHVYCTVPGKGQTTLTFIVDDPVEAKRLCARVRDLSRQIVLEEEMASVPIEQQLPRMIQAEKSFVPKEIIAKLKHVLPGTVQHMDWRMVYSTMRDGISLNSFYRMCEQSAPTLLIVQDDHLHTFGAFAPDPWRKFSEHYYGIGSSFLFTFQPSFRVFHWTGDNDCVQLSDDKFIGMGGGGAFGLWLDAGFVHGTSRRSPTYDNDPLPGAEEFRVLRLEVYTFTE